MPRKREPRIDAYIRNAKPFARQLLTRIRVIVHRAVPKIEESIKWGMPAFLVDGQIVSGMAGFTAHGALWFWSSSRLVKAGILRKEWTRQGMGSFGKLTGVGDLPSSALLVRAVRRAAAWRKAGGTKSRT